MPPAKQMFALGQAIVSTSASSPNDCAGLGEPPVTGISWLPPTAKQLSGEPQAAATSGAVSALSDCTGPALPSVITSTAEPWVVSEPVVRRQVEPEQPMAVNSSESGGYCIVTAAWLGAANATSAAATASNRIVPIRVDPISAPR